MSVQESVEKKFAYLEAIFSLPSTEYEEFLFFTQKVATHTVRGRKYYIRTVSMKNQRLFFRLYQIDHIGNVQTEFMRYIGLHTAIQFLAKLKKFEYAYAHKLS